MDYNLPGNAFHICRLFFLTLTNGLYYVFDLLKVYNLFNDRQPSQLAKRLVNNLSGPIKHGNTNNPLFDDFDDFDQQALAAQQRPVYVPRPNILPQPIAVKLLDILTLTFFYLVSILIDVSLQPLRKLQFGQKSWLGSKITFAPE